MELDEAIKTLNVLAMLTAALSFQWTVLWIWQTFITVHGLKVIGPVGFRQN